jgi:lysyl-tRNA synthetase, class II
MAADAVGAGLLGPAKAGLAAFVVGLLVTFLFVRINTRLIRANVRWWFHNIESKGGLHVHHMVIGVVLMVVAGLGLIAWLPAGLWLQFAALVFGAGVALTLDEFALILRLEDVYWTTEGRISVDAVIVAVCAGLLLLLGISPLSNATTSGATGGVVVALIIVQDLAFALVCLLKGKLWTGFFGLFIPVVGIIGAVRLARPRSPWARRRYAGNPRKLTRAQRREEHVDATWRAWREAFFDLIAGKPHLPSVSAAETPADDEAGRGPKPQADAGDQSRGEGEEGKEMAGEGGLEPPIP